MSKLADPDARQTLRSPLAVAIWWLWVLFAVANLIDLAIQGRDHLSAVAAITLLVVTGVVYVTALRPRIVTDADGLTIVNPVRVHRVGWAAVAGLDATDLLRVRCEWPTESETGTGKRVIYSWAVHSSRRGQITAQARAKRKAWQGRDDAPSPAPLGLDPANVAATLTERAEKARTAAPETLAAPPASSWHWPSVAAVVAPALALLIVALA